MTSTLTLDPLVVRARTSSRTPIVRSIERARFASDAATPARPWAGFGRETHAVLTRRDRALVELDRRRNRGGE